MSPEIMTAINILLRRMQDGGRVWDDMAQVEYWQVCREWPDDLGAAVRDYLRFSYTNPFRPTVAEFAALGARLYAPAPDADACYKEVLEKAERFGLYGRMQGRLRVEGSPPFSHPAVQRTVERLGGWRRICTWEQKEDGMLPLRLREAHAAVVKEWTEYVVREMMTEEARRHSLLRRVVALQGQKLQRTPVQIALATRRALLPAGPAVPPSPEVIEKLKAAGVEV